MFLSRCRIWCIFVHLAFTTTFDVWVVFRSKISKCDPFLGQKYFPEIASEMSDSRVCVLGFFLEVSNEAWPKFRREKRPDRGMQCQLIDLFEKRVCIACTFFITNCPKRVPKRVPEISL